MYKEIKLALTQNQLKKIHAGKPIRLTANQIGTGDIVMLHPLQFNLVQKAKRANRGINILLSVGEVYDSHLKGSGFFSNLLSKATKVANFIKSNWNVIKPVVSLAADTAAPMLGPEAVVARQAIKKVTGVGLQLEQPKQRCKPGKRKQLQGSSFLLN